MQSRRLREPGEAVSQQDRRQQDDEHRRDRPGVEHEPVPGEVQDPDGSVARYEQHHDRESERE